MASRGFLIRFIDIGLIVLFAFLMISDIENSSRVELDAATVAVEDDQQQIAERAFLTVEIAADGLFTVGDARSGDGVAEGLPTAEALTGELRRLDRLHQDEDLETVVLIMPHGDSPVQFTVDVMDVCDRLSLTKSLQVDIVDAGSPPPPSQMQGR